VAEAMGVKFLAQGKKNSSRRPQLSIKPGTWNLAITRQILMLLL